MSLQTSGPMPPSTCRSGSFQVSTISPGADGGARWHQRDGRCVTVQIGAERRYEGPWARVIAPWCSAPWRSSWDWGTRWLLDPPLLLIIAALLLITIVHRIRAGLREVA